jgi:hypothetical protein
MNLAKVPVATIIMVDHMIAQAQRALEIHAEFTARSDEFWWHHQLIVVPLTDRGGKEEAPRRERPERKRRSLAFTKRDVARAVTASMHAGLSVQRVDIDKTGRISIVTGQPEQISIAPENEWDSVK